MISQPKIDLAVLVVLFGHAEADGDPETPSEIAQMLQGKASIRRVTVALEELVRRGEVDRTYDHRYSDEGLFQISRAGITTIEKALRIPSSFIARLCSNGLD